MTKCTICKAEINTKSQSYHNTGAGYVHESCAFGHAPIAPKEHVQDDKRASHYRWPDRGTRPRGKVNK